MSEPPPPAALIAEVTHRCPLSCAYCSNPLDLARKSAELETAIWVRVLREAAALGVLHVHFTGGEPMARRDLPQLVAAAAAAGLYVNLITSGVSLDERTLAELIAAGLDHVQLSFQDATADAADAVGGYSGGHARKLAAAERVVRAGLPLTANFVVHRGNLDHVGEMIELAERLGASRIEIAHVQYHGWAMTNRAALMPTLTQVQTATAAVTGARARLSGRIVIDYVAPDYFSVRPKACMGGWGQRMLNVSPAGLAMPCHAAASLPNLPLPSVRDHCLEWIWRSSEAFRRFRAPEFAPSGCRGCERFELDWGGCRCQAFALTGDATATDPVCDLSPDHGLVLAALAEIAPVSAIPRGYHSAPPSLAARAGISAHA